MPEQPTVWMIGHSDHAIEAFVALLRQHDITVLVDLRSQPYSRWAPQFNRETLSRTLQQAGLGYRYMGDSLGGRPSDRSLYEPGDDSPDYERLAQTPALRAGIEEILALASRCRLSVMCSEGDHERCHRHLLLEPALAERGARVVHICPDGTTAEPGRAPSQLSLF